MAGVKHTGGRGGGPGRQRGADGACAAVDSAWDILIIGGGASGLAAAVTAGRIAAAGTADIQAGGTPLRIAILEKMDRPGRKLAATGNGRCNLSHTGCPEPEKTASFFRDAGIMIWTDETGRMYPHSEEAGIVAAQLAALARSFHVAVFCRAQVADVRVTGEAPLHRRVAGPDDEMVKPNAGAGAPPGVPDARAVRGCAARDVKPAADSAAARETGSNPPACDGGREEAPLGHETTGFQVRLADGRTLTSRLLLLATGGKSQAVYGSSGDGYGFARRLGHTVHRLLPVLTPIEVAADISAAAGARCRAAVSLYRYGERVASTRGEVQWNRANLSGICILDLSRHIRLTDDTSDFSAYAIGLDLLPDQTAETAAAFFQSRWENGIAEICAREGLSCALQHLLQTAVKARLAAWLASYLAPQLREMLPAAAADGREAGTRDHRGFFLRLAGALKDLRLSVTGTAGWKAAQVTRGGVALEEVDMTTMASLRVPGLYLAGEVLDWDGPCGGYNLDFAWRTGMTAGRAMAEAALRERTDGAAPSRA